MDRRVKGNTGKDISSGDGGYPAGLDSRIAVLAERAGLSQPDVLFSFLLGTFTDVLHLGHEVYQSAFPL